MMESPIKKNNFCTKIFLDNVHKPYTSQFIKLAILSNHTKPVFLKLW
jgi:hypothetical protein